MITNPTIAYGLLLIGIYGLLFEGYNPGAVLPGVVGAIALLALFAFQVLSVNYAGLALIALGALLIVAEFFVPSFGALGLGGLIAFVVGSIMLLDTRRAGLRHRAADHRGRRFRRRRSCSSASCGCSRRSRRRPVVTGVRMVGSTAEALDGFERRRAPCARRRAVERDVARAGQRRPARARRARSTGCCSGSKPAR